MNHRDRQIQKQFKQRFYHYTAADSRKWHQQRKQKSKSKTESTFIFFP